jgi:hypothetical protein
LFELKAFFCHNRGKVTNNLLILAPFVRIS